MLRDSPLSSLWTVGLLWEELSPLNEPLLLGKRGGSFFNRINVREK